MDMVYIDCLMVRFTQENGKMVNNMEMERLNFQMEMLYRVFGRMDNLWVPNLSKKC